MQYPINLINAYKKHEITRAEFCRKFAAMQGFNNTIKGFADSKCAYVKYRDCTAIFDGCFTWYTNGQMQKAQTLKEFKTRIDINRLFGKSSKKTAAGPIPAKLIARMGE